MKAPLVKGATFVLTLAFFATSATAWDGIVQGKISGIDVANAQNYAIRVYLDGSPICGTSAAWAYMNKDWDNYEAMLSMLTSAYLAGKTVIIYTDKTGEYCQIGYAAIR